MPIYDYTCSSCGHRTEVIHGINDPAPRFCPSCGAEGTLRKAFSTPAILFKGSGWAKKDRAATRSSASSASEKAGEKSDDKPAEKGSEGSKAGDSSADSKTSSSTKSSTSTSSTSSKAAD